MSAFAGFKELFKPDIGRAFPTDPFVQLDREQAIRRLELDRRAAANAAKNLPRPDSQGLDEVELEIVAEIQKHATRSQTEAASNHRVYGQRLAELSLLRELSSITAASERALGDFNNLVINVRGRLSIAADQVRESYRELLEFKTEHGLRRPAHDGVPKLVAWSTFLISGAVETALNSVMLKVNDDYGYLGGLLAAAVVAAVNVGFSAFVGRLAFPYLFHRRIPQRLMAILGTTLWFAAIVCWNLLAAQFRDAKAQGLSEPDKQALVAFIGSPFHLDSIYSYGLLVAGLLFAIISAVTALKMKDPYPGYGDLYERHEDRCHDYADEIEEATSELTIIRNEASQEATEIRTELGAQFRERGQIITNREYHRNRFRDHQRELEEVCNSLLEHYRNANLRARHDGEYPAHFRQRWHLSLSDLPSSAEEPTTENEVRNAEKALSDAISRIGAAYNEAISSFKHLDAIKEELRNG
ncbi:hypothetical protein K3217_21040 [bacterium BD-1]|nr:hypothetical protein [Ottowia caeni]